MARTKGARRRRLYHGYMRPRNEEDRQYLRDNPNPNYARRWEGAENEPAGPDGFGEDEEMADAPAGSNGVDNANAEEGDIIRPAIEDDSIRPDEEPVPMGDQDDNLPMRDGDGPIQEEEDFEMEDEEEFHSIEQHDGAATMNKGKSRVPFDREMTASTQPVALHAERLAQPRQRTPGGHASPLRASESPTVRSATPCSPSNPDPTSDDEDNDVDDGLQ